MSIFGSASKQPDFENIKVNKEFELNGSQFVPLQNLAESCCPWENISLKQLDRLTKMKQLYPQTPYLLVRAIQLDQQLLFSKDW